METTSTTQQPPVPFATYDERAFECAKCWDISGTRTPLLYSQRSSRSLWRSSNLEVVVVSATQKAKHRAVAHIRDDTFIGLIQDNERRGRLDFTAGISIDDIDWPLPIECYRCGHTQGRGLGKRRFLKLIEQDSPIRI